MRALIEALTAAGFAVQLRHDNEETTWENHGFVAVLNEDGEELVRNDAVQHNRNYGEREEIFGCMSRAVFERLGAVDNGSAASFRTSSL